LPAAVDEVVGSPGRPRRGRGVHPRRAHRPGPRAGRGGHTRGPPHPRPRSGPRGAAAPVGTGPGAPPGRRAARRGDRAAGWRDRGDP